MRIISGAWRGRPLVAPKGDATRPTADRTREALFSMLVSRLGGLDDLSVADLFAGSGALGLEALSRGAANCLFVEQDRAAIDALKTNIAKLSATGADVRQKSVVSPLLGRLAYAKQLDDGAWDRAFEGAADWDLRCLASFDAQPPLGDWLPARSVQAGDSWELEPAVIERAFRLDVRELLMPLPKGSEYVPPPQSDVPWRAAKWSGSASVSSIDDKKVLIALRIVGDGVWTAAAKPATVTVEEEGARMTFGSMESIEETLTTTLKGELVYDRKLGCCTSLQLKGELRCSTSNALGEKGQLIRREQGSFVVKVNVAADS